MQTTQISLILKLQGIPAAERQLSIIGDQAGDGELAVIVEALTYAEVAALVGEGDYTKPSIASHFVTPEQFIGALERLGARWGNLDKKIHRERDEECRQEVVDFILSVVLTDNLARQATLLQSLLDNDLGREVLILIAVNEKECVEFLRTPSVSSTTIMIGTWQEVYSAIENFNQHAMEELRESILTLYSAHDESSVEEGHGDMDKPAKFVHSTLRSMVRHASKHVQTEAPKEKVEQVFADI